MYQAVSRRKRLNDYPVLGIDPSTVSTGIAMISGSTTRGTTLKSYSLIKLKGSIIERVGAFYKSLYETILNNQVSCIALETPFVGRNIATYGKLSMLRGAVYVLASQFNIRVVELPPTKVKQLVTSKGGATKQEVAQALRKRYNGLPDKLSDDITDAIGVAYAGLIELKYRRCCGEKEKKGNKRKKNTRI